MLRRIIGWIRHPEEDWKDTMHRMKIRLNNALNIFPIEPWSIQLARKQFRRAIKLSSASDEWPFKVIQWNPNLSNSEAHRDRGRPKNRWDDKLSSFSFNKVGSRNWLHSFITFPEFTQCEEEFISLFITSSSC